MSELDDEICSYLGMSSGKKYVLIAVSHFYRLVDEEPSGDDTESDSDESDEDDDETTIRLRKERRRVKREKELALAATQVPVRVPLPLEIMDWEWSEDTVDFSISNVFEEVGDLSRSIAAMRRDLQAISERQQCLEAENVATVSLEEGKPSSRKGSRG